MSQGVDGISNYDQQPEDQRPLFVDWEKYWLGDAGLGSLCNHTYKDLGKHVIRLAIATYIRIILKLGFSYDWACFLRRNVESQVY